MGDQGQTTQHLERWSSLGLSGFTAQACLQRAGSEALFEELTLSSPGAELRIGQVMGAQLP